MTSTSLRAPSPSRATCSERSASTFVSAARKSLSFGSAGRKIFGPRAAPVANASRVSEVEVSPSIVTALNVSVTASDKIACKAGAAIGASVNTKDSMVAMSGAIMPAPFAMPLMVTVVPPIFACAVATFGNVSVVMMAFAASRKRPGAAFSAKPCITPLKRCAGSGSPITPVEARKTSVGLQPEALLASVAVKVVASRPVLPVKAFALPEFTTSARALPPWSFARHHSTGAEGHLERVSTPATAVPFSNSASSTSVRP